MIFSGSLSADRLKKIRDNKANKAPEDLVPVTVSGITIAKSGITRVTY